MDNLFDLNLLENELEVVASKLTENNDDRENAIGRLFKLVDFIESNTESLHGNESISLHLRNVCNKIKRSEISEDIWSRIQSIQMRIGFLNFSILPDEIMNKHINPHLYTSNDRFNNPYPTGKAHKALACTSKKHSELVVQGNQIWHNEHSTINDQIADVKSKGFKSSLEAITYIKEQGYVVADLRQFSDVTDEIIEKLFENYSNLYHLSVARDRIKKLPAACSQLLTLDCRRCDALTALPDDMASLTTLDCSGCPALTALPAGMASLTTLYCCGCKALTALPTGMASLTTLDCNGCDALTALPADLPENCQVTYEQLRIWGTEHFKWRSLWKTTNANVVMVVNVVKEAVAALLLL